MNSLYLVVMLSLIGLNMITILNYVYFRAVKGEPGDTYINVYLSYYGLLFHGIFFK